MLNVAQYEASRYVDRDPVKCTKIPRNPGKIYGADVYHRGILSGTPGQYRRLRSLLSSSYYPEGGRLLVVITGAISLCLILLSSSLSSFLLRAALYTLVAFPECKLSLFISAKTFPYPCSEILGIKWIKWRSLIIYIFHWTLLEEGLHESNMNP